jgi:hypothetical protein
MTAYPSVGSMNLSDGDRPTVTLGELYVCRH